MIIDEIAHNTLNLLDENLSVVDLGISLSYTYCIVKGRRGFALGLAHTTYDKVFHGLRDSSLPSIDEIPRLLSSWKLIEKTVGLALLNAISQYLLFNKQLYKNLPGKISFGRDILDSIQMSPDSRVLIIGYIRPVINRLRERGFRNIYVIEREPPTRFESIYSDLVLPRISESIDIVFITGSVLVNDTIDNILRYTEKAKKVIVGPSAQVLPQILSTYDLDIIGSVKVNDVWKTAEVVRRAGGTRAILKYSEKYVYMK